MLIGKTLANLAKALACALTCNSMRGPYCYGFASSIHTRNCFPLQRESVPLLVLAKTLCRAALHRAAASQCPATPAVPTGDTRIRSPPPLSPSFSSPPRRQANDDEHGYFPTEDSRRPEACQAGVDEKINLHSRKRESLGLREGEGGAWSPGVRGLRRH